MWVDYLSCRLTRSGGTKIIAEHVRALRQRGHEVRILTTSAEGDDLWGVPVVRVKAYKRDIFKDTEIIVGTWLRDVQSVAGIKGPVLCHLCQGYEPIELSLRIQEEAIPPKYDWGGTWGRLLFLRKKWSFKRRIRHIDQVYRLPTVKMAVSKVLKDLLERTYGSPCYYVPNGVDPTKFFPPPRPKSFDSTLRLLSVGPMDIVCKGIHGVLEAVRILKQKGVRVEFIRISLSPPSEMERNSGLVDQFLTGLSEDEMAEVYRRSHILIAPSLWEGFGLPVIEAMSSHVPCILTNTGSYSSLSEKMDFAYFVPSHSPEAIAEGVLRIRDDPLLREEIVRKGAEVARRYSIANMGEKLEEALLDILKRGARDGIAPCRGGW